MVEQAGDERVFHAILKGRLVLALVSARAERCPRKTCGRLRRCAARFGQVGSSFHTRIGDCPNMSEAEWRVISLGMQRNLQLLKPHLEAREGLDAAQVSRWERLSPGELRRRWSAPEAAAKRAAEERRRLAAPGSEFWTLLWSEFRDDAICAPCDVRHVDAMFVRFMAERGCRCAVEQRSDGCGEGAARCEAMANGE